MSKVDKNTSPELHDFVVEFRKYKTELTKKFLARKKWEPLDISQILAHIPGTIVDLYVEEGAKVAEGEKLMVLEAMKMRNTIYAEFDGVISSINVKVGDKVRKNQLMFEMDFD